MSATYTPLRYPGGKAKFGPYLAALMKANKLVDASYAEPYAGGAGAGLFLLFRGYASELHLNDVDRAVVSFWRAILTHNERFARRVEGARLTVKEWDKQKVIFRTAHMGFDLGFAFFYLNRTNRSGIMNGGVIGGRDQSGPYGIDARFNGAELAQRIRAVGTFKRRIRVTRQDALDFIDDMSPRRAQRSLTYFDPPYFTKGHELYTNFYKAADHAHIAQRLASCSRSWLMTYDDCPEIRGLYRRYRMLDSELSYSARQVRRGREVVILGPGLREPAYALPQRRHRPGFAVL
jgi:DNA adenine methylase